MCTEEKLVAKKTIRVCLKAILMVITMIVLYMLPSILAEKISYWRIKNIKHNN